MKNKNIIWKQPNLVKILECLFLKDNQNVKSICRKINIAPSNGSRNLKQLQDLELIVIEKTDKKREVYYRLTEKGKQVAKRIKEINEILK